MAKAAGKKHIRGADADHRVDIVHRAEVAAPRLKTQDLPERCAGARDGVRQIEKPVELIVADLDVEVLVDEHDAFAHVLQHRAHRLARLFDLGARRIQVVLALLGLGDVDGRAGHADGTAIAVALRKAALARPVPGPVRGLIAILG